MKSISVRVEHKGKDGATFQNRHDERKGHVPDYVDQSKMHLNSIIISPVSYGVLKQTCDTRRALRPTQKKMKSTAAVATVGIITFSTAAQKVIDTLPVDEQNKIFEDVSKAIAERLDNEITGLVVHRDEYAIHGHFQMPAYSKSGIPTSKIINPKIASGLQDIAGAVVMKYGISRGVKKAVRVANGDDPKKTRNRSVKQLHEDLPAEIAELEKKLAGAAIKYEKQRQLISNLTIKINSLTTDCFNFELKIAQAKKTLDIYENRAADAEKNYTEFSEKLKNSAFSAIEQAHSIAENTIHETTSFEIFKHRLR